MHLWLAILILAIVGIFLFFKSVPLFLSRAAWLQQDRGVYDLAESYLRQAAALERLVYGVTGYGVGLGLQYSNLAALYKRQNRLADAISAYGKGLA